jgi:hypothetical protein
MPSPHRLGKLSAPFAVLGGVRVCVLWGERVGCMRWIDWPMKAVKCVAMMISCIVASALAAGDMPQAGTEGRSRPRTGRRDSLQRTGNKLLDPGDTPLSLRPHTRRHRDQGVARVIMTAEQLPWLSGDGGVEPASLTLSVQRQVPPVVWTVKEG